MVAFYNQGDQDIYNSGIKFRPQQKYLQNPYNLPTNDPTNDPVVDEGIVNTNAFNNSGNDFSVYNPDPNSIVNRNYDPYPYRQAGEIYSKTFNPQPFAGGLGSAQDAYNYAQKGIDLGFGNMVAKDDPNLKMYRGDKSVFQMQKDADDIIQDEKMRYATEGQYVDPYDPRYSSRTGAQKFMDNFPEYYTKPEPTGLARLGELAGNFMPGAGIARFIGDYLPVNRRSILENELSGQGVMVNNIGQIVQGDGAYDTAGNVMAGYNANKMTANTFDKRLAKIAETMGKKGYKGNLQKRVDAIEAAKANFLNAQGKTDLVFEDEEAEKKKKKKKGNIITRFLNKKKETKAADAATAAAERANRESTATIQDRVDRQYQDQMTRDGRDFSVSGPDTSANPRGRSNQASSERGYQMHGADGGRAGYFFGGRVNFKNGGLASIL